MCLTQMKVVSASCVIIPAARLLAHASVWSCSQGYPVETSNNCRTIAGKLINIGLRVVVRSRGILDHVRLDSVFKVWFMESIKTSCLAHLVLVTSTEGWFPGVVL